MGEVRSIVEQVARELCRFQWGRGVEWDMMERWEKTDSLREARKLVKMVCGSCGLAKPLMENKEDNK